VRHRAQTSAEVFLLVFGAEFSAVGDDAGLSRSVALVHRLILHLLEHAHALHHFAEHNVLPVQMRRLHRRDEKLAAVGVFARVGHGQESWTIVPQLEVLILELLTVNALTAGAVMSGEITALTHEVFDDPVEGTAFVVKWLTRLCHSLVTSAKSAEVLGGSWHDVVEELKDDSASFIAADLNVKIHFWVCHFDGGKKTHL